MTNKPLVGRLAEGHEHVDVPKDGGRSDGALIGAQQQHGARDFVC